MMKKRKYQENDWYSIIPTVTIVLHSYWFSIHIHIHKLFLFLCLRHVHKNNKIMSDYYGVCHFLGSGELKMLVPLAVIT